MVPIESVERGVWLIANGLEQSPSLTAPAIANGEVEVLAIERVRDLGSVETDRDSAER